MFTIREKRNLLIPPPRRVSAGKSSSPTLSYPYTPLDGRSYNIRLLDLLPGRWNEPLAGVLRVVSLDFKPLYEAVSYTWGSATENKSLRLNNGCEIEVTDNLHKALRRFRRRFTKRTLWVDAICIDQSDVHDRQHQVPKMGTIYKQAVAVLIWLGEYPDPSPLDEWRMRLPHGEKTNPSLLNERGRKFVTALNCAIRDTEPRWSDRAWVVQEFVLAQKSFLCFGPVTMAYDTKHIIDLLTSSLEPLPYLRAFHEKTSDMKQLRYGLEGERQSICEAALYTSAASCSESHDKVYSLLSLISNAETQLIQCNYERPCAITFAEATFASINAQNTFTILELVNFTNRTMVDLPTWAVDFNVIRNPDEGRLHLRIQGAVQWPTSKSSDEPCARVDASMKLLTVIGIVLSKVARSMALPTTNVFTRGQEVANFAVDFAVFLEDFFRRDTRKSGDQNSYQPGTSQLSPELFLYASGNTGIHHILGIGCLVWNEVVGGIAGKERAGYRPFWECDENERTQRIPRRTPDDLVWFMQYTSFASGGCVMFTMAETYIGWAPSTLRADDLVVLLSGCKLPIVLRQSAQHYSFQGFAYVHDIMDEQLLKTWDGREIKEVEFVLE